MLMSEDVSGSNLNTYRPVGRGRGETRFGAVVGKPNNLMIINGKMMLLVIHMCRLGNTRRV